LTEPTPLTAGDHEDAEHGPGEGAVLARGAFAGVIGRGLGFGMQYAFLAAVGRTLGAEPAAPFYALLAAATVLAVFGRAGLDRFGLREIAAANANGRSSIIRALIARLLVLQLLWCTVLVVAALALRQRLADLLGLESSAGAGWLGVLAIGIVVTFSLAEYVLAFKSVLASALVKTIVPYGIGSALLLFAALNAPVLRPPHVAASLIAGMAAAIVAGAAIILRKTAGVARDPSQPLPAVEVGRSIALAAVPLLMLGMTGLDIVLLQAASPGAQTSFYQAAARTSMTLTLGLLGINAIAAPMIAASFAAGKDAELGRVVQRASRWSLLQAAGISVLLIVAGKTILQLFGAEFTQGYPILLVLIGAQLINAAAGPVVQLFVMTGNERAAFAVLLPVVMVTVPCYYVAGESMGGIGVAIVTALAFAAWNGGLVVLAKKRFGVWSHADNWLRAAPFILGAAALAAFVTSGRFSVWGIAYFAATAVGLWGFCLTGEDRRLLLDVVSNERRREPGRP
jgi:O-antigen/teichoic acid export membrane protein